MARSRLGPDWEMTIRMGVVMFLITIIALFFLSLLAAGGMEPTSLILIAAVIAVVQYFASEKLVLMSMGARVIAPQEQPELHMMVERLASLSGLPKPKIAISDKPIANAFAIGRNPKNATLTVTTALLRRLEPRELEAVLAHEISHIANRDVTVITLASFLPMLASYAMNMLFWMGLFGGFGGSSGRSRESNGGALPLMVVYLGTTLVYWASFLCMLALTRYREYAADRGSALLTGAPLQLASALQKISGMVAVVPEADLRQVQQANAFFIIPAARGTDIAGLFSTHPPIEKRIERLRRMQMELEG